MEETKVGKIELLETQRHHEEMLSKIADLYDHIIQIKREQTELFAGQAEFELVVKTLESKKILSKKDIFDFIKKDPFYSEEKTKQIENLYQWMEDE